MRAVFPALLLLRHCDKGSAVMDTLYFLTRRTDKCLELQREKLNNASVAPIMDWAKTLKDGLEVSYDSEDSDGEGGNDTEEEDSDEDLDLDAETVQESDGLRL